jgi:hypothetical protein
MAEDGPRERVLRLPALAQQLTAILRSRIPDAVERDLVCVTADLCISDFLMSPKNLASEQAANRLLSFASRIDKKTFEQFAVESRAESLNSSLSIP